MSAFSIRPSRPEDVDRITAIYAHHVATSTATFELVPPDQAEMARRRAALVEQGLPWLVAEGADGGVLGYAYAGPYRSRPAYAWTLEDSIYLHPDAIGRGIGRALLVQVIEDVTARGYRQMVAVIGDSANAASVALHRACGFQPVGVLVSVGRKFDRWIDTVLMQRPLGPGDNEPATR